MEETISSALGRVRDVLAEYGLLLESDRNFPSVATLTAGAPVLGSWWSHPLSHAIYAVTQKLTHDSRVLVVKLIAGKVTYLDRKLWSALLAVAQSGERWQTQALSVDARKLFREVTRLGEIRTDTIETKPPAGRLAVELEKVLLIHATDIHTASGAHAKQMETWDRWLKRSRYTPRPMESALAKSELEGAFLRLPGASEKMHILPWQVAPSFRRRAGSR